MVAIYYVYLYNILIVCAVSMASEIDREHYTIFLFGVDVVKVFDFFDMPNGSTFSIDVR